MGLSCLFLYSFLYHKAKRLKMEPFQAVGLVSLTLRARNVFKFFGQIASNFAVLACYAAAN